MGSIFDPDLYATRRRLLEGTTAPSPTANPPSPVAPRPRPLPRDTLQTDRKVQPQPQSCWTCIKNFFKTLWQKIVAFFTCKRTPSPGRASTHHSIDIRRISEVATRDGYIWFYEAAENPLTAVFGNFHACPVTIRRKGREYTFSCAEAVFQAMKFWGDDAVVRSFQHLNGQQVFERARELTASWTGEQRAAWHAKSISVMEEVVFAKFSQNPVLRQDLLATGRAYLVEHLIAAHKHREKRPFWTDGHDGSGPNQLGHVLMRIRGRLGGTGEVPRPADLYTRLTV